ncbi:glycosyltransferase family 2 protein [Brumimicrobium oceani]|uniref:Glycosyltransferase 2-like domain-containing protein n=1 Tax=Brumimicrobium oceani TaxID=2100725 RepID=A0A2U2XFW8_9FLAO|nr:glycosyltransferase [Brumimicrobium oceani]PWH86698.1 hypothetical protein DIT68_00065 [Brumimicrobium oceani]
MSTIGEFISYIQALGPAKFLRVFWFFVIFEFFRYFLLDLVGLILHRVSLWVNRKKWKRASEQLKKENPLVSIIVPGKNEGKHIFKLVKSLSEQTYQNYELIIIDDGSDDNTPIICKSLLKNGLIDQFYRNDVRGGKASAANLGLRFTKGKFIIHLDADCSYDNDAVEKIILPFYYDKDIGGVGGNVMVRNYKESLVTTLQAVEYFNSVGIGRIVTSQFGIYRIISGAFGAFRADVMDKIQGWDIGPGLDGDITVKIRKSGYKIHFAPEAVCLTSVPNTFKKLAKQRYRWDKSLIRFRLRKHKDVLFPNQGFSLINFISFFENILYNLILNFKWYFYAIDLVINFPDLLVHIMLTNLFLYTTMGYIKLILFGWFRTRSNAPNYYFLPYIPLMVIYFGYFLRFVRTRAYFMELFFKASYNDPWNPLKTSVHAKEKGL